MQKKSNPCMRRGRLVSSKDKNPHKSKWANIQDGHIVEVGVLKETHDITNYKTQEEIQIPKSENGNDENKEISISYVNMRKRWNRKKYSCQ